MVFSPKSSSRKGPILGIWDGHDAGAALVSSDQILVAINEERLSRRKLEIGFPQRSIQACLDFVGVSPSDIGEVAVSTADLSKTLARCFPSLREEYYLLRRRMKGPGRFNSLKKHWKYRITEFPASKYTRLVSRLMIRRELNKLGPGYPFNRTHPGLQFSRGGSLEGDPGSAGARAPRAAWATPPGAAWWR